MFPKQVMPRYHLVGYWLRFEWQHRGSTPHVHGLAWLCNVSDVECLMSHADDTIKEEII